MNFGSNVTSAYDRAVLTYSQALHYGSDIYTAAKQT
jgi:hypothetical protein